MTFAVTPNAIAIAVMTLVHAGSRSLKCDPSERIIVLQESIHPVIAHRVTVGPTAQQSTGAMCDQYNIQWNVFLTWTDFEDANDTLDRLRDR